MAVKERKQLRVKGFAEQKGADQKKEKVFVEVKETWRAMGTGESKPQPSRATLNK